MVCWLGAADVAGVDDAAGLLAGADDAAAPEAGAIVAEEPAGSTTPEFEAKTAVGVNGVDGPVGVVRFGFGV